MMQRFEFEVFADYFQFYLQDESAKGDLSDSWTQEAVDRLLAVASGAIGVGTVRNMSVPVIIEVDDEEPAGDDTNAWDQVNECSVEIQSGRIVVAGCTDYFPDAARVDVKPGWHRARIYYGELDSLSESGLEGRDHYKVVLWNAAPGPLKVIRARSKQAKN
jgi:hypothetical protein